MQQQKKLEKLPTSLVEIVKSKKCILKCYYDKELQCCGSCFRTLEEIKECGNKEKRGNICQ